MYNDIRIEKSRRNNWKYIPISDNCVSSKLQPVKTKLFTKVSQIAIFPDILPNLLHIRPEDERLLVGVRENFVGKYLLVYLFHLQLDTRKLQSTDNLGSDCTFWD